MAENRYFLTKELEEEFKPKVLDFIKKINDMEVDKRSSLKLDLSDTQMNPSRLGNLLIKMGYSDDEYDENSRDYWTYFNHTDSDMPSLCMKSNAECFSLVLSYNGN